MEEKNFYLTPEGLKKAKREYYELKNLWETKSKEGLPEVWHSEELSPEFVSFQEDMTIIETKLNELEYILRNAKIVKHSSKKESTIGIGSRVKVLIDNEEKDEFMIVGIFEANPSLGKISNESPVGKAIMGHKVGEEISISSPVKTVYKIISIK